MIPDEAVEAAAHILQAKGVQSWLPWDDVHPSIQEDYRADAREILEAAAPHMLSHERETLDAIAALHQREVIATHEGYGEEAWCPACRVHWPCKTANALDATTH